MALHAPDLHSTLHRTDVKILHLDSDLAVGCAENVFGVLWRDRTTPGAVAAIGRAFSEYAINRGRDVVLLTVIERQAKMPSPGSREPLAQFLKDAGRNVYISALVFEGDGFLAASIRGVVVGLTLLARQPYPHRVFEDVARASRWIETESASLGRPCRASELQLIASTFRHAVLNRSTVRLSR